MYCNTGKISWLLRYNRLVEEIVLSSVEMNYRKCKVHMSVAERHAPGKTGRRGQFVIHVLLVQANYRTVNNVGWIPNAAV